MLVEQAHAGEGPRTKATLVTLVHLMGLVVGPEVGAVGEGPAADLAVIRSLASVRPLVALEEPLPREGLATELALARQSVRAYVHLQGGGMVVALGT